MCNPADVAFFACLTTTFWATARLGEFVLRRVDAFDPRIHISPGGVSHKWDPSGRTKAWNFALPRTKVSEVGEDVMWTEQPGLADPKEAFERHLSLNAPPTDGPLFAYRSGHGHTPMTRTRFLGHLKQACGRLGVKTPHGHSLRIGGTLELLLRGVPFEVVKTKGRWKGESFQRYLREHSAVLAPYLRAVPDVHEEFRRIAVPPPR
jgi:hypothetical protein